MLTTAFFFSSGRRHTRWNCDWSSDVCSSDLTSTRTRGPPSCPGRNSRLRRAGQPPDPYEAVLPAADQHVRRSVAVVEDALGPAQQPHGEMGRIEQPVPGTPAEGLDVHDHHAP